MNNFIHNKMKLASTLLTSFCYLFEHLALNMLQALNLVILSNHGLNQRLLSLQSMHCCLQQSVQNMDKCSTKGSASQQDTLLHAVLIPLVYSIRLYEVSKLKTPKKPYQASVQQQKASMSSSKAPGKHSSIANFVSHGLPIQQVQTYLSDVANQTTLLNSACH